MTTLVWPQHELRPSHQVEVGRSALPIGHARQFLRYGVSERPVDNAVEVAGKPVRKRRKVSVG